MTIFCFDIDGTICSNTAGKYKNAKVFPGIVQRVNFLYDAGHKIIFMTARGSVSNIDYSDFTRKQLKDWGFKFHELIMNKKPHADIFIDDKAINANEWRTTGKRVGFVASSFDLIHPGYVLMLKEAKYICDHLVCALHVDPSIERPEKNRPVQTYEERLMVLEAIRYVDEVVKFETEEDLLGLIKTINPNIRILGTDYKNKSFTGMNLDIDIHWHKRDHQWSTSDLRKRIFILENNK